MMTQKQAIEPKGERSNGEKRNATSQYGTEKVAKKWLSKKPAERMNWPKLDARHWRGRLFKGVFTRDGERMETADWCVRIAYRARRETFNLGTPNSEAAAARALQIYRGLVTDGWEATLAAHKPQAAAKQPKAATVGEWLASVQSTVDLRKSTFTAYAQSLRQIASEIADIGDQPRLNEDGTPKRDRRRRVVLMSRKDTLNGGREAWLAKVDTVLLSDLTAAAVQRWKIEYINRAGDAPDAKRRAENTAATLIRCARSLFSMKCRKFADEHLVLPDPLPFAGVEIPKKGSTAYKSRIDARQLIEAAQRELTGEPFKAFVLALVCGFRKREIDLLSWAQVDFQKGQIRIERTEWFAPKSEDSVGVVDLDAETLALLRGWKAAASGAFVIESDREPSHTAERVRYRCEQHFTVLYAWLRAQGITAQKPLHELRKELGAILASEQGIFAAQSVLRHAQISTTAAYYADKKGRITAGLGALLAPAAATVVPFEAASQGLKAKKAV